MGEEAVHSWLADRVGQTPSGEIRIPFGLPNTAFAAMAVAGGVFLLLALVTTRTDLLTVLSLLIVASSLMAPLAVRTVQALRHGPNRGLRVDASGCSRAPRSSTPAASGCTSTRSGSGWSSNSIYGELAAGRFP